VRRRAVLAAIAGSAALGLAVAWSRRQVRLAEERYAAAGTMVELSDGSRLHVLEEGEGTPLVLIHGADGVMQGFTETVFDTLAESHRVLAVDRPGHGWSKAAPGSRHDVPLDVRLIREAVHELGVRKPIVVGHSYGGAVALRWAIDHPEELRALVLMAPAAYFPWRAPLWLLRAPRIPVVGPALTEALLVPLGRIVLPSLDANAFSPDPVPDAYAAYSRALFLRPSQFRALTEEYRSLPADVAYAEPRYRDIALPTVIVAGDRDNVTVTPLHAMRLAEEIGGAELVLLPDTGHELQWTHPEAVVEAVRRAEERAG
jgi:pimeloyl-ACP methyl ester carboxylesterase